MLFFGAITRSLMRRHKARSQLESLDQAIAKVARECSLPVLEGLTGIERFQSATKLLDATLLARTTVTENPEERSRAIDTYLQKLHEEYHMAQDDLKQAVASRAEVIALGLALKEIALTFDRELDAFASKTSPILMELQTTASQMRSESARQAEQIVSIGNEMEATKTWLASAVEAGWNELHQHLAEQLSAVRREGVQALQDVAARLETAISHQDRKVTELQTDVERSFLQVTSELGGRLDDLRGEQQRQIEDVRHQFEATKKWLASAVEASRSEFQQLLTDQLSAVRREGAQALQDLAVRLETAISYQDVKLAEIQTGVDRRFLEVTSEFGGRLDDLRGEQQRQIEEVRRKQKEEVERLSSSVHTVKRWIYGVAAIAGLALLLAFASL